MTARAEPPTEELVEARFGSVLEVARQYRTSVALHELSELLPNEGPDGAGAVSDWLAAHPGIGTRVGDRAVARPSAATADGDRRRARGARYLEIAQSAVDGPLAPLGKLVRCIAVTGSAAYGEPSEGDDLDFLLVTRRGAVWPALLYTYLVARGRRFGAEPWPHWCFNYVLDERAARSEFARSRGFLFAREALTARPISGESYYRGLIGSAAWLEEEVPRLFRRWSLGGLPPLPDDSPAPLPARLLNAVVFPLVAAYLNLVALAANHRLRTEGRGEKQFRIVAGLDRLTYATDRFEQLKSLFRAASMLDTGVPAK
jgi:hypothetical protein